MGELEPWIDEHFIRSIWFNMGEAVNVKMIRDKISGYVGKAGRLLPSMTYRTNRY